MRLTDSQAVIRPRSTWEALDLGVHLARAHAGVLIKSWALLTLPLLALLTLLLWDYPSLVFLLFWWLKPLFDRLPLHILAQGLFGDTLSARQALGAYPRLAKGQLLASLTWRRFSLQRSFLLPVQQLEGLSRTARSSRVRLLTQHSARTARALTLIGIHIELALYLGGLGLVYFFIPAQMVEQLDWFKLLDVEAHGLLWIEHLTNLIYALALLIWEPVYVACGFTLYLNRRTILEGWDIELAFRRLRQRLLGTAYALVLAGCAGLLSIQPVPALADEAMAVCPLPPLENSGPDTPRLLNQPLTSEAARQQIKAELAKPPFRNEEKYLEWHFGQAPSQASSSQDHTLPGGLLWFIRHTAQLLEVMLWTLLGLGLLWILWHYRAGLSHLLPRIRKAGPVVQAMPEHLFGLDVKPESLPADLPAEVERLWPTHPREALGLLYRGLLSRLLHDFQLPLREAYTEGEILSLGEQRIPAETQRYLHEVTQHWQGIAYGHRLPNTDAIKALCASWRKLFTTKARP